MPKHNEALDELSGLTPEEEISLRQDLNQSTPIIGPVIKTGT